MTRLTVMVVAAITIARAIAAATVPLTGDEAYYWEWAKHLALGYADHPPMVALLIAPVRWATASPFLIRLPFLLCGVVATLAVAAAARSERAACAAALALTLAPLITYGFVVATPDSPMMAFWALSLWLATRLGGPRTRRDFVWLGAAVGCAILSKLFACALAAGIVAWSLAPPRRRLWREGLWLSALVALVVVAPFLVWNAGHGWITFVFALGQRHVDEPSLTRPLVTLATLAAAYSPGLWLAALIVLLRPRSPLVAWTAAPLCAVLLALDFKERVELYWFFGPYVSLCVGIGAAFEDLSRRARAVWGAVAAAPAAVLVPLLFAAALFPGPVYARFLHHSTLREGGPFEIFTYWPLAQDVRRIAGAHDAMVVTDGYGFSSQMDYEAGIPPVVIGYDPQGQEAKRWYDHDAHPARILFVDKVPFETRPDFERQFARACGAVRPGPALSYVYHDPTGHAIPARTYYLTWCDDPKPDALAILNWASP